MSNALALREKYSHLEQRLNEARPSLDALIPVNLGTTSARMVRIVLDFAVRDPAILDCTTASIIRAVQQSAEVGLEIGSPLGEAYLVPFKNWKRNYQKEAQFIAGYKGLVKLALGGPKVQKIEARLVRERDDFSFTLGTSPAIQHNYSPRASESDRGPVTNAYAIAFFHGGETQFDVMSKEELDRIRDKANPERKKGSSWTDHESEMYRKCPIRRLTKLIELSPLLARAVAFDVESEEARGLYARPDGMRDNRADQLKRTIEANSKPVTVKDGEFEDVDK